ncbi:MAG: tetratricopeptide repeat protein [Rudaea sp.]|nr:tetratricopeptide repeat protein [Rudaea sp.]
MNFDPALGIGLTELIELISHGDLATARTRAGSLLQRYPGQAELWRLSAICALQQGEFDAAESALAQALKLAPNSIESLCNMASVHTARGRLDEAERALRHALALAPHHAAALNNLGSLLDARGDYHGAADCFAKAIANKPDYARAWLNQATALLAIRQLDRAESSARRAIALAPQWGDAHFVLGNVLNEVGRKPAALDAWRQAARFAPDNPSFRYQFALALDSHGDFTAALREYEACLRAAPEFWPALSQLTYLRRRLCDWHQLPPLSRRLLDGVDHGAEGITPFSILVEDSTPAQQLACARRFAAARQAQIAPLETRLAPRPHGRPAGTLRVGFISAGFGDHPTALLIVELIERLRGSQLRTLGYATTADDGGALRQRLASGFHEFHDISAQSLEAMLRSLRDGHCDILIDLDGYCEGSRPQLLALRPAPLQVNWLAYPGSLGAPWCEYLIADRFLIPEQQREHYSERIAWMPRCYQPSDTTRAAIQPPPRSQLGLPEKGIVFASFNQSWKFTLRSFARWMKILKTVPDSVLWLLAGPAGSAVEERMRRAANAAGVDAQRLVFAPHVPHAEHVARYRRVDLFLDTNPYNAHTTASDALWAGCPVLTQPGATFASRVAGSLNHQLGLDELNAASDHAYIELAIRLGQEPARLRVLRERVAATGRVSGLFDMAAYARDFEALLTLMFRHFERGDGPRDLELSA